MSDYPASYRYTKDHEWVGVSGKIATVGITDYAQGELGDIIYVELPAVGAAVKQGESFGTIEAVKTVAELYAPVSGEVVEVNGALESSPETVNRSPFADGWLIKIKVADTGEVEGLMDTAAYRAMVGD